MAPDAGGFDPATMHTAGAVSLPRVPIGGHPAFFREGDAAVAKASR
jgi:hypothetical protein